MKIKLLHVLFLFGCCIIYTQGLMNYNSMLNSIPMTQYKNISNTIMTEFMKMDVQKILKALDIKQSTVNEVMAKGDIKTVMNAIVSNSRIKELFLRNSTLSSIPGFFPPEGLSANCTVSVIQLVSPLLNVTDRSKIIAILLTTPLGRVFDSWGKLPAGLFDGSINWMGSYQECNALKGMKYCSSGMALVGKGGGTFGSCFPKQCSNADVALLLASLETYTSGLISFSKAKPSYTVCEKPVEYEKGQYITFSLYGIILALVLCGTTAELFINHLKSVARVEVAIPQTIQDEMAERYDDPSAESSEGAFLTRTEPERGNAVTNFLICFSLMKNMKTLFSTDVPKGAITSINGIRVISMLWIILGHYYFSLTFSPVDNKAETYKILQRFSFLVITNATVAVDTFFLLSGFLVAYLTLKKMDHEGGMGCRSVALFYLHRFLRLTPALGIVILFFTNVLPVIIPGPTGMGIAQSTILQQNCLDYWWSTLFYFNNFYPSYEKQCMGWCWYLANDTQFYIISPLILIAMYRIERRFSRGTLFNSIFIFFLCFIFLIVLMVLYIVYDLPAVMVGGNFPGAPRSGHESFYMNQIYIKPYTRITPYLIGLFLGYIISRKITFGDGTNKRTFTVMMGWLGALVTGMSIIYGTWCVYRPDNQRYFNDVENVFYGTFSRFAWACAVAWVIYACHNKSGGLINTVLSWKVWIPLGRLTYGAYLIHLIVYNFYFFGLETPYHYQDLNAVFHFIAITFVSYACAFVLAICVEVPVANLEGKLFKRR